MCSRDCWCSLRPQAPLFPASLQLGGAAWLGSIQCGQSMYFKAWPLKCPASSFVVPLFASCVPGAKDPEKSEPHAMSGTEPLNSWLKVAWPVTFTWDLVWMKNSFYCVKSLRFCSCFLPCLAQPRLRVGKPSESACCQHSMESIPRCLCPLCSDAWTQDARTTQDVFTLGIQPAPYFLVHLEMIFLLNKYSRWKSPSDPLLCPNLPLLVDTNCNCVQQWTQINNFVHSFLLKGIFPQPKDPKNSLDIHVGKESPSRIPLDVNRVCGSIPSILWSLAWENNKNPIGSVISLIWTTVNLFYITAQPLRILHWVSFY